MVYQALYFFIPCITTLVYATSGVGFGEEVYDV